MTDCKKIAVVRAGPAGLTAAYLLCRAKHKVVVFEKEPVYVDGIFRTDLIKVTIFI